VADGATADAIPYFVVIAVGGGIRAAYWTAAVLTALHDRYPPFARDLFVISGVSGGSLGAAVYATLYASKVQDRPLACAEGTGDARRLFPCARRMLAHDFLSPTLGTMLYPDLVQRFLPVPIPYFDRGATLEESFESAWRQTTGSNRFDEPFADLWAADAALATPSLILNGTSVEQGRRLLTTNLPVLGEATPPEFSDFDDVRNMLQHDVRVSTAVNNSARFTYVSPGGRIQDNAHIVDGGYFENSGATSAGEVVAAVPATVAGRRVVPVVIHIRNEPEPESGRLNAPNNVASETLTPVLALMNTRGARGVYAVEALKSGVRARGGEFVDFHLFDQGVPLPLGWALSSSATEEMNYQLAERFRCDGEIPAQLRRHLGEPAIPCTPGAPALARR
jgi:predicted acylesterase/phospholipase RssA